MIDGIGNLQIGGTPLPPLRPRGRPARIARYPRIPAREGGTDRRQLCLPVPQHPVEARKPKSGYHARGIAADLVPLEISLRAFHEIVRSELRIKGIGVDQAACYIHVDIRESAKPVLWVYNNGVPVVTANPFQEVVNG